MNTSIVRALLGNELRMLVRDRRTLILSLVLPLLLMPLLLFGSQIVEARRQQRLEGAEYRFAVTGPDAEAARPSIAATLQRLAAAPAGAPGALRLRVTTNPDPMAALHRGDLDFLVEARLTVPEARTATAQPRAGSVPSSEQPAGPRRAEERSAARAETPQPGVLALTVLSRGNVDHSTRAARRFRDALQETRRIERARLLAASGFPVAFDAVTPIEAVSVATEGQVAGLTLGRLVTLMLLMFMLTGGSLVAVDCLAGEKERGTLETLLTTGAARVEIVAAKLGAVFVVGVVVTVIQVANLLAYVGFRIIPAAPAFSAAVPPPVAAVLFLLFLPLAALVAAVLLLISGRARSYKEAQLLFFPVFLCGMAPALVSFLPGLRLRSAIALVPIANVAMAAKEILTGTFDWPMIAVTVLVNTAVAAWLGRLTVQSLSTERLLSPAHGDGAHLLGGSALWSRHVLAWFAAVWALFLILVGYEERLGVRGQALVNLLVFFPAVLVVILRRYRLDPREALALRPVSPAVWLAVAIGVPSGLLTGLGIFRLASLVIPVPPQMIEAFGRGMLPPEIPAWQIVLLLCVLPGIVEELVFRGVMLHGVIRRFRPVPAVLVTAVMFGLIHVSLFRLAPTAFLGVLFASATLLTGSIFPAMVWHFGSNLLSLSASRLDAPLAYAGPEVHALAAAALAVCYWILWRARTPYPGMRR